MASPLPWRILPGEDGFMDCRLFCGCPSDLENFEQIGTGMPYGFSIQSRPGYINSKYLKDEREDDDRSKTA